MSMHKIDLSGIEHEGLEVMTHSVAGMIVLMQ